MWYQSSFIVNTPQVFFRINGHSSQSYRNNFPVISCWIAGRQTAEPVQLSWRRQWPHHFASHGQLTNPRLLTGLNIHSVKTQSIPHSLVELLADAIMQPSADILPNELFVAAPCAKYNGFLGTESEETAQYNNIAQPFLHVTNLRGSYFNLQLHHHENINKNLHEFNKQK